MVEMLAKAKTILGYDLLDLCQNGPKEKLDDTAYAQPALFVAGLAAVEKLRKESPGVVEECSACAGLSLGEYCAMAFAGVITFEEGLKANVSNPFPPSPSPLRCPVTTRQQWNQRGAEGELPAPCTVHCLWEVLYVSTLPIVTNVKAWAWWAGRCVNRGGGGTVGWQMSHHSAMEGGRQTTQNPWKVYIQNPAFHVGKDGMSHVCSLKSASLQPLVALPRTGPD